MNAEREKENEHPQEAGQDEAGQEYDARDNNEETVATDGTKDTANATAAEEAEHVLARE